VYLWDFGLSKAVASTSGVTATGAVMGTLVYMPPEQIGAKPVDGQADQYALACSPFELLAGTPPFRRDEPAAVMYAHLPEPPPRLTSRRPGLPPAADGVLSRALAKAPGDRYASCGAVR
jgi:serine/threonine protein kinase